MGTLNSDLAWKKWGKKNPYYGVLSHEKYRNNNLTQNNLADFFESGQTYVDDVFAEIHQFIEKDFFPRKTLDFGCGTGRLVIPLSKKTNEIIGMDISIDMLREAEQKCGEHYIDNAKFILSDNNLSGLQNEKFDLINTYIVLQHINVSRGEKILKILLDKLNKNGIGVIHFVFGRNTSKVRKVVNYFRYRIPYLHNFLNIFQGKPFDEPMMQMNKYDTNKILGILYHNDVGEMKIKLTNHSGHLGAIVIFRKSK